MSLFETFLVHLQDWIEYEEIADLEERAKSQFFEKVHEEVVQRTQEAAKEKEFQSVPAGPAGVHEVGLVLEYIRLTPKNYQIFDHLNLYE